MHDSIFYLPLVLFIVVFSLLRKVGIREDPLEEHGALSNDCRSWDVMAIQISNRLHRH